MISDEQLKKIKEEVNYIVASNTSSPFILSLLSGARIIASERIPSVGVNKFGELKINPDFWDKKDKAGKTLTLLHEVLHLAFRHPWRFQFTEGDMKKHHAANVATDVCCNETLSDHGYKNMDNFIMAKNIVNMANKPADEIKKMAAEEIYDLIKDEIKVMKINIPIDLHPGSGEKGKGKTVAVPSQGQRAGKEDEEKKGRGKGEEKGDEKVVREGKKSENEEDAEEKWKEALARAAVAAKQAGKMPSGTERRVEKLLKSKTAWKSLLKQGIYNGTSGDVISTWRRPSRRYHGMPGIQHRSRNIYVLIDTSGSIRKKELQQFLGEIYSLTKVGDVIIYPWDAKAYEKLHAKNSREAIKCLDIKGKGGTVLQPVLRKVYRERRLGSVIILSDGIISDIENRQTQNLLAKIANKASSSIFLTTKEKPKTSGGWRIIKVRPEALRS